MGEKQCLVWDVKYCTVVRDYYDGTIWCYAHKHKDDVLDNWKDTSDRTGGCPRFKELARIQWNDRVHSESYRNDNAGEFTGSFEQARRRRGHWHTTNCPNRGHGQQNGVAERVIAILRNLQQTGSRSSVCDSADTPTLWPYVDAHAAKLINIKPTKRNENSESCAGDTRRAWCAEGTHMDRLLRWGCLVIVRLMGEGTRVGWGCQVLRWVPDNFAPGALLGLEQAEGTAKGRNTVVFREMSFASCWHRKAQ